MSEGEATLWLHLKAAKLPLPAREFRFAPPRKWRADFCWPDRMLIVECEGGTWVQGRHSRGQGFAKDTLKYNAAALLGYRVLRFTTEQVRDGLALDMIERALA